MTRSIPSIESDITPELGSEESVGLQNKVILVVDDEPLNLKMMKALLAREGCLVLTAQSGKEALVLSEGKPDLILLDIMMPEQNGFETCRLLKEKEGLKDIPIIFLSAFQDSETKIAGLRLGGVDFITKPFQREELLARVRVQLTLKEQREKLREYAANLEEMVDQRTRQLVHVDRLTTLGTLVAAVVHEVNNPLQSIMGNTELTLLELEEMKNMAARAVGKEARAMFLDFRDKFEGPVGEIDKGCKRLLANITYLKNFGKRENGKKGLFLIEKPIDDALAVLQAKLKSPVALEIKIPEDLELEGNRLQLSQIFINLIHNALDALDGGPGRISITAVSEAPDRIIIDVRDSGPGIPPEFSEKIFKPFFSTKNDLEGTGLGLFICRMIAESHQGRIESLPHEGSGAWFRITLPRRQRA
ncbi:MAG: response regulator [Thermodesulfobacteriota bacterium]